MDFTFDEEPANKPTIIDHSLWVEKYRPKTLTDYIGNESVKAAVALMIQKGDIPHLLLYGPAGTGKTSLAKLISKNIPCDVLYINASDKSGIDFIRTDIKNFACGAGFKALKVLILDEADGLSAEAQGALRNMMETYSAHTRLILTCNHHEKMITPIVSRCQTYEIKPISKKEVAVRLVYILQTEKIAFTQEDIVFIINTYYPDIRKVINFAQQSNLNGTLKIYKENAVDVDFLQKLISLLKTPSKPGVFNEIRQLVVDADNNNIEMVYKYLYDHVSDFAPGKEPIVILELAESIYQSTLVLTQARDITFMACIHKILKHLR
jgi:DNA polymerase III delta prime subunit